MVRDDHDRCVASGSESVGPGGGRGTSKVASLATEHGLRSERSGYSFGPYRLQLRGRWAGKV